MALSVFAEGQVVLFHLYPFLKRLSCPRDTDFCVAAAVALRHLLKIAVDDG